MKSVTTPELKTPISYYGGKQSMIKDILPLIPDHKIYVEPFFGGGAIFWAKKPSDIEVINDVNMNIINFNLVLKHSYFELKKKLESTLHSRETYKKALIIYECPWLFDEQPVVRAWAFYTLTQQGFASKIGTWGYDRSGSTSKKISNKIDQFTEDLSERLRLVQIEQNDACKVIKSRDTKESFIYADPPYVGTNQGHYGGYTEEHFEELLNTLNSLEGKFLLSSYPSEQLDYHIQKNGWHTKHLTKTLSASNGANQKTRKKKTEVLTANYPIE